jgi:four helix bundle protein
MEGRFHQELHLKMDRYVYKVYQLTKEFPKHEIFGVTSQLRRSALSVILNYIEGYARRRGAVYRNFLEISYASLKESDYLLTFALEEKYISDKGGFDECKKLADQIGAMLWSTIESLK